MSLLSCARTEEIREVLMAGRWPSACAPELREHGQKCERCREFVRVTQALRSSRADAMEGKPLHSASLLWWRAQLRKRHDAMVRIETPMRRGQVFALVLTLCVAMAFVGQQVRAHGAQLGRIAGGTGEPGWFKSVWASLGPVPLVVSAMMLALMSAVVVYLTVERE